MNCRNTTASLSQLAEARSSGALSPGDDGFWPRVTIEPRHGVPTQCLDGKPWFGWGVHRPFSEEHVEAFERLAAHGLRRLVVNATCSEDIYHPSLRFWRGPEQFDGDPQDRYFRRLTEICSQALLQLNIYVGAPPWWLEQHPDHCQVYADGHAEHEIQRGGRCRLPSLASPLWRREACDALKAYLAWLKTSGWSRRVAAIMLCYGITWEWGLLGSDDFLDYSVHGQDYFRRWLRRKYATVDRLSAAWGRTADFETATIPAAVRRAQPAGPEGMRRLPEEQDVIDHQQSLSDMNVEFLLSLADTVKSASDGRLLIGACYGYTLTAREHSRFMGQYGAGGFQGGHHALGRVLSSPSIDFLASPFNYADRRLGSGLILEHSPLASIQAHGKAFFDENDLWAWNNPPDFGDVTLSVGHTPNIVRTLQAYQLGFMQAIVRGKHQWLTELTEWIGPFRENFSDPDLLAEIRRLNLLGEQLIQRNRASVAEVALVIDEKSIAHLSLDNQKFKEQVYYQTIRWGHLGTPFDILLLDDLLTRCELRYKLVVAALVPTPSARQQLEAWAERHPQVLLSWDSPSTLEQLLERAGVHRYVTDTVTVWANATMVGVHVDKSGPRTVRFPSPTEGVEVISAAPFHAPRGVLNWNFSEKQVTLFVASGEDQE